MFRTERFRSVTGLMHRGAASIPDIRSSYALGRMGRHRTVRRHACRSDPQAGVISSLADMPPVPAYYARSSARLLSEPHRHVRTSRNMTSEAGKGWTHTMNTGSKRRRGAPIRDRIGAASVSSSKSAMTSGCPSGDSRGDSRGDLAMGCGRAELPRPSLIQSALVPCVRRARRAPICCIVRSRSGVVGIHAGAFAVIIDDVSMRSSALVRHLAVANSRLVRGVRSRVLCGGVARPSVWGECEVRSVTNQRCVVVADRRADTLAVPRRRGGEPG